GSFTSDATVVVTASINGSSQTSSLSLVAPVTLTTFQCSPLSLLPNANTNCSAVLSKAAPAGGITVALSSTALLLPVPTTVTRSPGSISASFSATAGLITTALSSVITAQYGSASLTQTISLLPPVSPSSVSCTPAVPSPSSSGTCTVILNAPSDNTVV